MTTPKFLKGLTPASKITTAKITGLAQRESTAQQDKRDYTLALAHAASVDGNVTKIGLLMIKTSARGKDAQLYRAWITAHTPIRYALKKGTSVIEKVTCKDWQNPDKWNLEAMAEADYLAKQESAAPEAKGLDSLLKTLEGYAKDAALTNGKVNTELNIAAGLVAAYMGGASFKSKLAKLVSEQELGLHDAAVEKQSATQEAGTTAQITAVNKAA